MDFANLTITRAREGLDNGEFKVQDLVDFYLNNINEKNEELNIYLSVFKDIKEQTKIAQKRIDDGQADILTGIPLAIKANIAITGQNMNCGSKILKDYTAPYNATVIKKLREQGVVFLGYTNMDEFACGASGENSAYGVTQNPVAPGRVPGGSSSGSIAAVSADTALASLGTDTSGSVRQPASFCGLVGARPTYGRVSRSGNSAMGSSFDQICPITRTVKDSQIILNVIAGQGGKDMTAIEDKRKGGSVKKIGVPRGLLKDLKPEITNFFEKSLENFEKAGYKLVDVDLDIFKYAVPIYYTLMPAELSTNLARLDGLRYGNFKSGKNMVDSYFETRGAGFGDEIKRRIILGTYVLSAGYADQYYNKALILREKIKQEFQEKIKNLDAVVIPTTPTPAFKFGENSDPIDMYYADVFTAPSNIIGSPAISVPAGLVKWEGEQLPMGIQIMTARGQEDLMYEIAIDFEKAS